MIKKKTKLQIQGHNFSQAYRRHNLGVPFYHRGKFYNWYYYVFHYVLFKSMKQNRDNDNSRAIILARLMGGTVCGRHFDQIGTLNNWYHWSLSLFHYILSKKGKSTTTKQRQLQIQGHNFSQVHGRHNFGAPFWPGRQSLQLILLQFFISHYILSKKGESTTKIGKSATTTTKNTVLRGHEQALARSWPKNERMINRGRPNE